MMWRGVLLAAVILMYATLVEGLAAIDLNTGVYLLTPGQNPSCGGYTAERASGQGQQFEFWALGFLSGINITGKAETDFLKDVDGKAVWAWIDNYCREHPLDQFPTAVGALTRELVNRQSQRK